MVLTLVGAALFAQPKLTGFSPLTGDSGTVVTISGSGFNTSAAANLVRFGVVQATVLTAAANQLTVKVPVGANYSPLSVTNLATGKAGYSSAFFLPSFSPIKGRIHDTDFGGSLGLSLTNAQVFASTVNDMNNDGKPDLLALGGYSNASTYRLYFGTNSTALGTPSVDKDSFPLSTTAIPLNMTTGDLDGDGKNDVVFTLLGFSSVSILRNTTTSAGGFIWFAPRTTAATNGAPYGVALIDVDGDGKKDIVTTSRTGGMIFVLPNTSTVGSISFGTAITFSTGKTPEKLECADFDGDGKWDIVTTNRTATSISVLLNTSTGAGNFNFANKIDYATAKGVKNLSLADMDNDGKTDIVATCDSVTTLSIFRNLSTVGNISFAPKYDFKIGNFLDYTGIADFDGDGKLDVAVNSSVYITGTTYTSYYVSIAKNNSTLGNFSLNSPVKFYVGRSAFNMAYAGDITLDGKPDFSVYGNGFVFARINYSAPSGNADLSALNILGANLTPSFTTQFPRPTTFTANIPYDSATIHVVAAVIDTGYASLSVQVNGKGYSALTASVPGAVSLDTGNNLIQIKVTAQNGSTKLYTINAIRWMPPQLSWINTNSGTIGTLLKLKGKNLLVNPTITIGGTSAVVWNNTDTTLSALVMPNTVSGKIIVTTISGSVAYKDEFVLTTTTYPSQLDGARQSVAGGAGNVTGSSLSLSADGNTAVYGSPGYGSGVGAMNVSVRNGSGWSNIAFYTGSGAVGKASLGSSVAVSADGSTIVAGAPGDNTYVGAAWVYVLKNGYYQQQGNKLVGSGYSSTTSYVKMGSSVAISADGNTLAIGGPGNNFNKGMVWIYTRTDTVWKEQASLTGTVSSGLFGSAISFSADGNTLLVGSEGVNNNIGSSFVYVRSGTTWTQQAQLTGTGYTGLTVYQGASVSLSADGNVALIGGYFDSSAKGACWVFKRTGTSWKQDGKKIANDYSGANGQFGYSVSLNADGTIAAIGSLHNSFLMGQPSIFKKENGVWTRKVNRLSSTGLVSTSNTYFGAIAAISADGNNAVVSAYGDESYTGAVWHYYSILSTTSTLSALTTSVGSLSPTFNKAITSYTVNADTASTLTITPTATDSTAIILGNINGGASLTVISGTTSSPFSLNYGANTLNVSVVSQAGATTVYTLTVNRNCPKDTTTTVKTICPAALPFTWNGNSYSASGTYYKNYTNAFGCDSVAVLQLTVANPVPTNSTINLSGCNSVTYKGNVYTVNTTLADTLKTQNGCDSVFVTINITLLPNFSGSIKHPTLGAIANVTANLSNGTTTRSALTSGGNYQFDCLSADSVYTVKPSKNNDVAKGNGISTIDLLYLQSHILNKTVLNSPYKIIAADLNNSGDVTTIDLLYLKRFILTIDTLFPGKRLWAFVDSSYNFPNPAKPFPYKDSIRIANPATNAVAQSFVGVKLGDLNFDWNPATLGVRKPNQPLELEYRPVATTAASAQIRIPIKANRFDKLLGLQFTLHFDASEYSFAGIDNNLLQLDYGTNHLGEGAITFLWTDKQLQPTTLADGTTILELVLTKRNGGEAALPVLQISSSHTPIEAWDGQYALHSILLKTTSATTEPEAAAVESYSLSPNPTGGDVFLALQLAHSKTVRVTVSNAAGQKVRTMTFNAPQGRSTYPLSLRGTQGVAAGMYYVEVEGMDNRSVKKLVIR